MHAPPFYASPPDPTRRRIIHRARACALLAFLAACSLYAPWHGVGRGIGEAIGCAFSHGGCDSSVPSYADHRGVDDVDTWPALLLFALAGLAGWAALTANRRVQKRAGICAIILPLLLGPYVAFTTLMVHLLSGTVSRGGDLVFYVLMFATFGAGIVNARDPAPTARLPRAQALRTDT